MRLGRWRLPFVMGLRGRVLALVLAALVAVAVPATAGFLWIVDATIVRLATLFAEKQIQFDRYRGLESLMREVSLAETLARAPAILDWAKDENAPDKKARGIAELEHYRLSFRDRSSFIVMDGSGNYYFNDKDDSYAGRQLRYTVRADNPRDGWYFKTRALGSGCHLNVDHDDNLGVTKVWINCVMREGDRILGMIGTGVDLTQFIREVVDIRQAGAQGMFVDASGAVQAHRDPARVDFHSLTKDIEAKKTVFLLLDGEADRAALAGMMKEVGSGQALVRSRLMQIDGRDFLVGVGYLDRIGWYNVTLMDVDEIIDRRLFLPLGLFLAGIMLATAALLTLLFKRKVLDRLARVETAAQAMQIGDYETPVVDTGDDEIGRLSRTFNAMARAVGDNTHLLEAMVAERTEKLRQLADRDTLTEVFNRRGFVDAFALEQNRARRTGRRMGLLLVDLDHFKRVNDTHGHHVGDRMIVEVVRRIASVLRNYDICGRWGGDELIVFVSDSSPKALAAIADKMLRTICDEGLDLPDGTRLAISVSIGAYLVERDDTLAEAIAKADAALYVAKRAGRGNAVVYDEARHGAVENPLLRAG